MEFQARLQLDSMGVVTLRTPEDSVSLARPTFNILLSDYKLADSTRIVTDIGIRDGQAIFKVRAWIAGLLGAIVALLLGILWLVRRSRREQQKAARVAEQRRAAEEAREAERQALAHDLHDGVLQMLYAVRFHLPPTDDVATVDGLIVQTAEQVRAVTARLRAPMDETVSLVDALRSLPALYPDVSSDIKADEAALAQLSAEGRIALYRVAQEAVSNAVRHGGAQHVAMRLGLHAPSGDGASAPQIVFAIDDNGAGFDTARPFSEDRPHFGLTGMRERAEALGGDLVLESTPGQGSRLRLHLPASAPVSA